MKIPLIADKNHEIARNYGVYLEQEGFSLRGLFIIDAKGIVRQITINGMCLGLFCVTSLMDSLRVCPDQSNIISFTRYASRSQC
jgi:alkyl hydroperoxide reductase subunit AhpC